MSMKKRLITGIFGLISLLTVGLANAEVISLTPTTQTVTTGASFDLTVSAADFFNGASAGGVSLSWDAGLLQLNTTVAQVVSSLTANGFDSPLAISLTASTADVTSGVGFFSPVIAGPTFDFLTLNFTYIGGPSTTDVLITNGAFGPWQDAFGQDITGTTFNGASVTVLPAAVPLPAAVWLFGSGLLGVVGVARRRQSKK